MPIYAYKCSACGHAADVLQKISADPLTICPSCGKSSFSRQLTAPGFQLKGSGWYVTDFKGGAPAAAPAIATDSGAAKSPDAAAPATTGSTAPATPTPAPAATATPAAAPAASPGKA